MGYFSKHRLIALTLLIQLIALPLLLILTREPQTSQGKAAPSTTISLSPETNLNNPHSVQKDEYFAPSIIIEPGPNIITQVKVEIFYDPTKIELVKSFPISINTTAFPNTIKAPVFSSGKIEFTVAVKNSAEIITEKTKVATLFFKATDVAPRSYIYFGNNTLVYSLSNTTDNVLQNSVPFIVNISTPSAETKNGTFNGTNLK